MTTRRTSALRLLSAHALAGTATTLPVPLLTTELYRTSHSAAALSVFGACRMLPSIALGAWAGRLADRTNCRTLLQASVLLRALLLAALAGATAVHAGVTVLIGLGIAATVAGTPAYAGCGAALRGLLPHPGRLDRATQMLTSVEAGAWVAGPALGGALLAVAPPVTGPCTAVALLCTASAVLARLPLPPPRPEPGPRPHTAGSWRLLSRAPGVVLAVIAVNVSVDAVASILRLLADSDRAYGLLAAGLGGGAVLCLATARWPRGTGIVAATGTAGSALLAAAAVAWMPGRAVLLLVAGTAAALVEARATARVQQLVPPARAGEALGVLDQVIVAGALVGAVLGPAMAEAVAAPATVAVAGGLLLAVTAGLRARPRRPAGGAGNPAAAQRSWDAAAAASSRCGTTTPSTSTSSVDLSLQLLPAISCSRS